MHIHATPRVVMTVVAVTLALAIAASAVQAAETTVTFDDLPALPSFIAGQFVPEADRLSNQLISAYGIEFSSEAPYVAVVNGGAFAPSPQISWVALRRTVF
jgi:hypothetical protein